VSSPAELPGHAPRRDPDGEGPLGAANRALAWVNDKLLLASMVALLAAAGVLTLSVVTRYFLKVATDWQDEASVFLMVGATFACGAYVQSYRGHVGIAALASVLPPRINRLRLIGSDVISLAFCAFFAWKSWSMFQEAVEDHQTTSSSFGPPLWIPYVAMALGMTLVALQLALQLAGHFRTREATS
jgi:TRAP-type C4-dicarboxylate transport system permease small subunit